MLMGHLMPRPRIGLLLNGIYLVGQKIEFFILQPILREKLTIKSFALIRFHLLLKGKKYFFNCLTICYDKKLDELK